MANGFPNIPVFGGGMARTTPDGGVQINTPLGGFQVGGHPEYRVAKLFEQEVREQQRDPRQTLTVNEMNQIIGRAERDNVKISVKAENGLFSFSLNGGEYGPPLRVDGDALQVWSDSKVAKAGEKTAPAPAAAPAVAAPAVAATPAPVATPVAAPVVATPAPAPTANVDVGYSDAARATMDTLVEGALAQARPADPAPVPKTAAPVDAGYSDAARATMDTLVEGALAQARPAESAPSAASVGPKKPELSNDQIKAITLGLRNASPEEVAAIEAFLGDKADGKKGVLNADEITAAANLIQSRNWGTPEDREKVAALGKALGVQGVSEPAPASAGTQEPYNGGPATSMGQLNKGPGNIR